MSLAFTVCDPRFSTSWLHSAESNSTDRTQNHVCSSSHSFSLSLSLLEESAHNRVTVKQKETPRGKLPATSVRRFSLPTFVTTFVLILIQWLSREESGYFFSVPRSKTDISTLKLVKRISSSSSSNSTCPTEDTAKRSRRRCAAFKTIGNMRT